MTELDSARCEDALVLLAGVSFPHCMAPAQGRGVAYRMLYPDETWFGQTHPGTTLPAELNSSIARNGQVPRMQILSGQQATFKEPA
jgi:hypothetical protein